MSIKNKRLLDDIEIRINERIEKLKSGLARKASLAYPSLPKKSKLRDKKIIQQHCLKLSPSVSKIKRLHNRYGKYVVNIWDKNEKSAAYLTIGKAISNLGTVMFLAKKGKSVEYVDLTRSAMESLDLTTLFLEEEQGINLNKWFKGGVVGNKKSRKLLHKIINKDVKIPNLPPENNIPIKDVASDIYGVYSLFTHTSYPAVLDMVDVYNEDFDHKGFSGYHYSLSYLHIIDNLAINIALRLKHVFGIEKDLYGYKKCNKVLLELGHRKASPEEISEVIERYGS